MYRLDSFDSRQRLVVGCFKHGNVMGFIKYIFLIIAILLICEARLYAVGLEKNKFYTLCFLHMCSFTLPSSNFSSRCANNRFYALECRLADRFQ